MPEYYYRYDEITYPNGVDEYDNLYPGCTIRLWLQEFEVISHTPKGVWIKDHGRKRFILSDARKKYACSTIEDALISFRARKEKQIRILSTKIERLKLALQLKDGKESRYCWR